MSKFFLERRFIINAFVKLSFQNIMVYDIKNVLDFAGILGRNANGTRNVYIEK